MGNISNSQGRCVLEVFPEEVWETILLKVKEPRALLSCYNTCLLFKNVLSPTKNTWMMDMTFPLLYAYLDKECLLKLRLVSKKWNSVVDKYLKEHPSLHFYHEDTHLLHQCNLAKPLYDKGIGVYTFSNPNMDFNEYERQFKPEDFVEQMSNHPRNPFIGGTVEFYEDEYYPTGDTYDEDEVEEMEKKYFENSVSILKEFGKHIHHLKLDIGASRVSEAGIALRKSFCSEDIFKFLPNLRSLSLSLTHYLDTNDNHVIPEMPFMKSLSVEEGCTKTFFANLFNKFHHQLCRLSINFADWYLIYELEWNSLTELNLFITNTWPDWIDSLANDLKAPQLRKLCILQMEASFNRSRLDNVTCKGFVNALRKLAAKCENFYALRLDLSGAYVLACSLNRIRKAGVVENIRLLEIEHDTTINYGFLLRFPNLEKIQIYYSKVYIDLTRGHGKFDVTFREYNEMDMDTNVDEKIEVQKYIALGKMHKSNIWEKLPRLKVLIFQRTIYYRENVAIKRKFDV